MRTLLFFNFAGFAVKKNKEQTAYLLYIGETSDIQIRIQWHNSRQFKNSHTKIANDWILFYSIVCINIEQARKIEKHIKIMKSKIYLLNLKKYPEITEKLLLKYS